MAPRAGQARRYDHRVAVTPSRNVRVDDYPWEASRDRARDQFQVTRSSAVRALLLAFVAGECDDLVSKYLTASSASVAPPHPDDPQLPLAASG
jgi:hypothetical protein